MSFLRPLRRKDRNSDRASLAFMEWIKSRPCAICSLLKQKQATITEAAHIGGNAAAKASNWSCIPLCYAHHRDGSDTCEEVLKRRFFERWGLDKQAVTTELRERFEKEKQAA